MSRSLRPSRAEAKAAAIVMRCALRFFRGTGSGPMAYDHAIFLGMQLAVRMMVEALPQCRKHERRMKLWNSLIARLERNVKVSHGGEQ